MSASSFPVLVDMALPSPQATAALARRLAGRVGRGDVLLLSGPIGAGKTHFARAFIQARMAASGQIEDVPSPTFTLVQTYDLPDLEIWHADLYRLTHPDEVIELGLADAFETSMCLVEWPDRLGDMAPEDALHLDFALASDVDARKVTLWSNMPRWGPLLEDLAHD